MHIERFSSYERLIGSTARIFSFLGNIKRRLSNCNTETNGEEQDTALQEERSKAEILWFQEAQKGLIKEEWKNQFMLYLDDHSVWRCGGSLGRADLPYSTRHPMLLPKEHPFTALVVRRAHHRVIHSGLKATLTEIRSRFWIPQGKSLVRQFINRCVICRRFATSSYRPPPPPPLPKQSPTEASILISRSGFCWASDGQTE